MKRALWKYHRLLGLIVALPLLLTVLTGMATTIEREWNLDLGVSSRILLRIHTGEIFHLQAIYPILDGLGLIALLVTGLNMSGVFRRSRRESQS
ncbi:MAG: peptidase [Leptolyngbya sp. ERB_1_1]